MSHAIGRFQTGTFLLGGVHAEDPTKKRWYSQSIFCGGELRPNSANRYNVAKPQLLVLIFFQS